jgi:hypothetical protein
MLDTYQTAPSFWHSEDPTDYSKPGRMANFQDVFLQSLKHLKLSGYIHSDSARDILTALPDYVRWQSKNNAKLESVCIVDAYGRVKLWQGYPDQ